MPKHSVKRLLAITFGVSAPILALAGCPGFPGITGSPSPSPSASKAAPRTGLLISKINIGGAAQKDRTVTVKNTGTAEVDLAKYVVSYEYNEGGLKMQHLRFGTTKLAAGSDYTFAAAEGCADGKCVSGGGTLGGTTAKDMGLQASHGSMVLYRAISTGADIADANMTDYVQYGTANAYTHAAGAVTQKHWNDKDKYAPAPGAVGKALSPKSLGDTGDANWSVN